MMNAPSEGYHLSDNRSETRILEMSDHHHTSSISSDTGVVIDQKLDLASGQTLYLPPLRSAQDAASMPASPAQAATSKSVVFHVLCPQSPETPARLPLRLNVRPHDTTESLMSTIRNFHGLWDTPGTKVLSISLEDQRGSTIIPRYENFEDDMAVYVRATLDSSRPGFPPSLCARANGSPIAGPGNLGNVTDEPRLYEHQSSTFPMLKTGFQGYIPRPPMIGVSNQLPQYGHMVSGRPELHLATRGEPLSLPDGRYGPGGETGAMYSDSDEGPASTAGSKKEIVSAEISLDNIVAGARRKRVNKGFESSVSCVQITLNDVADLVNVATALVRAIPDSTCPVLQFDLSGATGCPHRRRPISRPAFPQHDVQHVCAAITLRFPASCIQDASGSTVPNVELWYGRILCRTSCDRRLPTRHTEGNTPYSGHDHRKPYF